MPSSGNIPVLIIDMKGAVQIMNHFLIRKDCVIRLIDV